MPVRDDSPTTTTTTSVTRSTSGARNEAPSTQRLFEDWRARSELRQDGLADDWEVPEALQLVRAVTSEPDVRDAAARFGRARCLAGWAHPEVLDDIEDLFTASPRVPDARMWAVIRAATGGWIDEQTAQTLAQPYRDALTGLPSVGFLVMQAEPLYRNPSTPCPSTTHSLVVAHLQGPTRGLHRLAGLIDLARRAEQTFGDGSTLAALGSIGVVALIENGSAAYQQALALSPRSDAGREPDLAMTLEALPSESALLGTRLAWLAGHGTLRPA